MKFREIKVGLMLLLPWQEAWAAEAFSFNRAHLVNITLSPVR